MTLLTSSGGFGGIIIPQKTLIPPGVLGVTEFDFNNNYLDNRNVVTLNVAQGIPAFSTDRVEGSHSLNLTANASLVSANNYRDISGALTVSAKVKPTAFSATQGVLTKWSTSGNNRAWALLIRPDGTLGFDVSNTGAFTSDGRVLTTASLAANVWSEVTAIFNPGTYLRIYVNKSLAAEKTSLVPTSLFSCAAPLRVGEYFSTSSPNSFSGLMDQVRIYDQIVLP